VTWARDGSGSGRGNRSFDAQSFRVDVVFDLSVADEASIAFVTSSGALWSFLTNNNDNDHKDDEEYGSDNPTEVA